MVHYTSAISILHTIWISWECWTSAFSSSQNLFALSISDTWNNGELIRGVINENCNKLLSRFLKDIIKLLQLPSVLFSYEVFIFQGLSNFSLEHLNYPTQIIFKSCKLIPVLIGSILIQKKKHKPIDFLAAFAMCVGLIFFTLADSRISPKFSSYGVIIILLALVFDAVIGNVQELAMKKHKAPNSEVVFYSYGIGFMYLFVVMLLTGHFQSAFNYGLIVSFFNFKFTN